jgi:hypothetical protein
MVHECFPSTCFSFPEGPFKRPIFHLNSVTEYGILLLAAFLKHSGGASGPEQHFRIRKFLHAGIDSESDLQAWLEVTLEEKLGGKAWDSCRKQAALWHAEGIQVFGWNYPCSGLDDPKMANDTEPGSWDGHTAKNLPCPAVLFGKGSFDVDSFERPWLAVFNSRKPRSIAPDAPWLGALRSFLKNPGTQKTLIATGIGTLTYDMVGLHAISSKIPLLLAAPFSLLQPGPEFERIYGQTASGIPCLSCIPDTKGCPSRVRLLCRDRILAAVSQIHLVLEIRSKGNLAVALEDRQKISPAVQIIFSPPEKTSSNSGNYSLLKDFPESAHAFKSVDPAGFNPANSTKTYDMPEELLPPEPAQIEWAAYLYHYTRTCAGPWPGETYPEYLAGLLTGDPLCAHSAIDTLIRIMLEDRVRAGSSMIRGKEEVVSWSAHPPHEISLLRKWNPALVRWTVEPFGLAVRRDYLRSLGAKPVVYGPDETFRKLSASEKYRFQLSRKLHTVWRYENEWRLRGDLMLKEACNGKAFLFVHTQEDREKLFGYSTTLPVICLDRGRRTEDGK